MTLVFPLFILTPSARLTEISRAGSDVEGSSVFKFLDSSSRLKSIGIQNDKQELIEVVESFEF